MKLRGNSQQSSVVGDQENQNKKQLIKDAFNTTNHGIPYSILIFSVISFGLLIIVFLASFFSSYYYIKSQSDISSGSDFIVNLTQSLKFY